MENGRIKNWKKKGMAGSDGIRRCGSTTDSRRRVLMTSEEGEEKLRSGMGGPYECADGVLRGIFQCGKRFTRGGLG